MEHGKRIIHFFVVYVPWMESTNVCLFCVPHSYLNGVLLPIHCFLGTLRNPAQGGAVPGMKGFTEGHIDVQEVSKWGRFGSVSEFAGGGLLFRGFGHVFPLWLASPALFVVFLRRFFVLFWATRHDYFCPRF